MKKSVNLYVDLGTKVEEGAEALTTKEKLLLIKMAGYDEFYTGIYDSKETIKWREQLLYAEKIGLPLTMMHCSYYEPTLNEFWLDTPHGKEIEESFITQIKDCGKYNEIARDKKMGTIDDFVVHLSGDETVQNTPLGLERLQRIVTEAKKYGIHVDVENLHSEENFRYVMDNIKDPMLGACYDCGHRNYLTPNFNVMREYGDRVRVVHLHSNDGKTDKHESMYKTSFGKIRTLAEDLAPYAPNLVLASELKAPINTRNVYDVLRNDITFLTYLETDIRRVRNSMRKNGLDPDVPTNY